MPTRILESKQIDHTICNKTDKQDNHGNISYSVSSQR